MNVLGTKKARFAAALTAVVVVATLLGGAPVQAAEQEWQPATGAPATGRTATGPEVDSPAIVGDNSPSAEDERSWAGAMLMPSFVTGSNDPWFNQICSAVLIAPRVAATTASCVTDDGGAVLPSNFGVTVLFDDRVLGPSLPGTGNHNINGVSRHPQFDFASEAINDLALLRLSFPVSASVATPVPFATPDDLDEYEAGETASVAGWGSTDATPDANEDFPRDLREADVPIVADGPCDAAYTGPAIGDDTNVCAGNGAGTGACVLDEGGPLTVNDNSLLVGLFSFGPFDGPSNPCASGSPDVYVELAGYEDFLDAHIADTTTPTFTDVRFGHPFLTEIWSLKGESIVGGYPDGSYRGGAPVTRQAMSAFMYRLAGEPIFNPPGSPTFSDVSTAHPFYDEIEWMADEEITGGYDDGTYRPDAPVTRQAMSAFMYRLAGTPPFSPAGQSFSDVSPAHPFYDEIEWMAVEGISTGYANGTYRPAVAVSRQAMAAFMYRLQPMLLT